MSEHVHTKKGRNKIPRLHGHGILLPPCEASQGRNKKIKIRIGRVQLPHLEFPTVSFSSIISNARILAVPDLLESMGRIVLYLSVLLVPALYSSSISYSGEFPKFIALLAIALISGSLFLFSIMTSRNNRFVQSPVLSLIVLFSLGYIVSAIFSMHPVASIFGNRGTWATGTIGIMAATSIAVVSANFFHEKNSPYHFLVYLTLSGFFTSFLFPWSKYILPFIGAQNPFSSFLPIPDMEQLSGFLTITTAANSALLLDPLATRIRRIIFIALLIQIAVIALAGPHLAILFVMVIFPFFSILTFSPNALLRHRLATAGTGICFTAIAAVIIISFTNMHSKIPSAFSNYSHSRIISEISGEISSWSTSFHIFSRHPLTGSGPELLVAELLTISKEFAQKYLSESLITFRFSNTYLTLLSTIGIIGMLPLILLAIYLLRLLLKNVSLTYEQKALLFVSVIFLASLFIHSLSSLTILTGFSTLGICAAHIPSATYFKRKTSAPRWYMYVMFATAIGYLGYGVFAFNKAEILYMKSTTETSPNNLTSATEAIAYNPYESAYYRAKTGYLIQYLRSASAEKNSAEVRRQVQQSVNMALVLNPYHYLNLQTASLAYFDLAEILNTPAYTANSLSYISEAIELSPFDRRLYLQRGIIFLSLENVTGATKDFDTAVSLDRKDWPAYLYIARLLQGKKWHSQSRPYLETVISESNDEDYVKAAENLLDNIPEK